MFLPNESPPGCSYGMEPCSSSSSEGSIYFPKAASSCVICGGSANCRHFGAFSCNACAAFFRRTVAKKKHYNCPRHGNCVIDSRHVRRICRSCRLAKCYTFGMQESEVLSLGMPPPKTKTSKTDINSDSECSSLSPYTPPISKIGKLDYTPLLPNTSNAFLNQILYTNDAVFHRRALLLPQTTKTQTLGVALLEINDHMGLQTPTGTRPSSLADSAHHATNEAQLFRMFINMSGLNEVIDMSDIHAQMSEIILYWCSAICLMNTLKFDTINDKQFTLIDNSCLEISEESILKWHSGVDFLRRDLQCLARIALPMFTQIEDISRQFRDCFMSAEETTYFLVLSLIEAMIRCSKNSGITRERFQPYMNRLFTSMKQYYKENFSEDSVATRIGRIVMMLPALNELHDILGKHRSLLQLCNWRLEHLDNENLYSAFHSMNFSDRS